MESGYGMGLLTVAVCGLSLWTGCAKDRIKQADLKLLSGYNWGGTEGNMADVDASTRNDPTRSNGESNLDASAPEAGGGVSPVDAKVEETGSLQAGRGGTASTAGRAATGAAGAGGKRTAPVDAGSQPVQTGCDLTGRWIATQRTLNEALGGMIVQSGHSWIYWQFEQHANQAVVQKELQCGEEVKDHSTTGLGTQVTSSQAVWDGLTRNNTYSEGTATYAPVQGAARCQLDVRKSTVVRGATFSYFSVFDANGFTHPIEDALQPAQGSTPGWEDWDNDGNPGVTYHISGIANGDVYMVQRDLVEYSGTTDKNSNKFRLLVNRLHEQKTISQNPSTLPSADVTPSADPQQHFIWFARVDGVPQWDIAADADDLAICAKMRAIKDELIPEGNE